MKCENGHEVVCDCDQCKNKLESARAAKAYEYLRGTTWRYCNTYDDLYKDEYDEDFKDFVKAFKPDYHDRATYDDFYINFSDGEVSLSAKSYFEDEYLPDKANLFDVIKEQGLKIKGSCIQQEIEKIKKKIKNDQEYIAEVKDKVEKLENLMTKRPELFKEQ